MVFNRTYLAGLALLALASTAARAGDILDPAAFASSGVLDLTSGAYVIDTSGGAGGAPILTGPSVAITGSTFAQGGAFDSTIGVLDFSNVTIGAGVTITVTGANPLALLSRGSEVLSGQILANGGGGGGGSGGGIIFAAPSVSVTGYGDIVAEGGFSGGGGGRILFLTGAGGLTDSGIPVTTVAGLGGTAQVAAALYGADGTIDIGLLPTTSGGVPEPAAWSVVLLGLAVVGHSLRRRQRANAC